MVMELESICRVCLKEGSSIGKLKSIFSLEKREGGHTVKCPDMLLQCASVTINKDDGYPGHICSRCFRKLWSAYKFRHLCEKSFEYLRDYVFERKSSLEIKVEKKDVDLMNISSNINGADDKDETFKVNLLGEVKIKVENPVDDNAYDVGHSDIVDNDADSFDDKNFNDIEKKNRKKTKKQPRKCKNRSIKLSIDLKEMGRKKDNGMWKCLHCPKSFRLQYRLLAHEDAHIGLKRYFCDICQKAYRSERDHKTLHSRDLKFICETCSKCFNTKAKLAHHIFTHNADRKKLVCGQDGCTKEFLTRSGLQRHKNFHDGVKDVICHLCCREFSDKYLLNSHLKWHANEKKYKCSYCDKRFNLATNRSAHEKIHTNIKNYQCSNCDLRFYNSGSLKRHFLCHSRALNEECRFCGKRFSRRDNRRRHEAVMHGVSGNSDFLQH